MKAAPHEKIGQSDTPYEVWVSISDDPYARDYAFLSAHASEGKAKQMAWAYLCGKYGVVPIENINMEGQLIHPKSPARTASGSPGVDAYISDIRMSNSRR